MISLKIVSALRGVTALNRLPYYETQHQQQNHIYSSGPQTRSLSTSPSSSHAPVLAVGTKASKINAAIMEAELDLPTKPKKPLTPWLAFVKDRKDEVLSQKYKMTASELAVILSKEWRYLDKSKYEKEYHERRDEYLRQTENYENSLTNQQREYLGIRKNLLREDKALRYLKRSKPPKLPRTCANFYCTERCKEPEIKEAMKSGNSGKVFSDLFKEYRSLSEYEKEKYVKLAQQDRVRFQEEFRLWYEGVLATPNLNKNVHEQANIMHAKFEALNYI